MQLGIKEFYLKEYYSHQMQHFAHNVVKYFVMKVQQ